MGHDKRKVTRSAMGRAKVTRRDVARAAGTSEAVVSYVVNNGPRPVAEQTRHRVLAAIETTGYRPNSIARALARGSTRTYGLIVPHVSNPFVASLVYAVEKEVFDRGFVLLLGDSADDKEQETRLAETFVQQQIDGLLFYGVDRDHAFVEQLAERMPVVILDDPGAAAGPAYVQVDEGAASAAATKHLIEHGYTSIAMITGPMVLLNSQDRVHGWRTALGRAGVQMRPEWLLETDYTRRGGYLAGLRLLDLDPRPVSVFASNESQAIGLLAAAEERGVRIPEDLAVMCFNGTSNAEYSIPALSAIEQPVDEIARRAVDILSEGAAHGQTVVCDFAVVARRSCGCTYSRSVSVEDDRDEQAIRAHAH